MIVQWFVFLVSVGMVVAGAFGLIAALKIPGRIRPALACLAACVPIVVGIWLFRSSGFHLKDWGRLSRGAAQEIQGLADGLREVQSVQGQLEDLFKPRSSR